MKLFRLQYSIHNWSFHISHWNIIHFITALTPFQISTSPPVLFLGINWVLNLVTRNLGICKVPTTINPEIRVNQRFTAPKFLHVITLPRFESCRLYKSSTVVMHKIHLKTKCHVMYQEDGSSVLRIINLNSLFITSYSAYSQKMGF